jgi:hypothetical protein
MFELCEILCSCASDLSQSKKILLFLLLKALRYLGDGPLNKNKIKEELGFPFLKGAGRGDRHSIL